MVKFVYNVIDFIVLFMNGNVMLELECKFVEVVFGSVELKEFMLFFDKFCVLFSKDNLIGGIDMKKFKDVFGGIGGWFYSFGMGKFGWIMNIYDFDVNFYEVICGNKIVYVVLFMMGKDIMVCNFGCMVIVDLCMLIFWFQKLFEFDWFWLFYMVFCDEVGFYVNDLWSCIFEQFCSVYVFFVFVVQICVNFQVIFDELYEMVIGNVWMKFFFKVGIQVMVLEGVELIGKKIGVLWILVGM